jgi:uncharacterized membrane protein
MAVEDEVNESVGDDGGGDGGGDRSALMSSLLSKEVLIPAAMSAGAAIAARKGPDLMRGLSSRIERKGEEEAEDLGERAVQGAKQGLGNKGGVLGKVASSVIPGGGGGGGGSSGKTRRLPIQRWTDVAVPVEQAYRGWTDFENFPNFMHRVLRVSQEDENKLEWDEKIWFSRRQWEGEITDRRKNDRIAWKTTSGMQHAGVVSFHQIAPRLTRVMVTMDFMPQGVMEKMASGLRFVKRAVQADLARFKAQVEMEDAKGIEYKSTQKGEERDEDEQDRSSGNEAEQDDQRAEEGAGRRANGGDDEDREEERRERESRRRERRESVGSAS